TKNDPAALATGSSNLALLVTPSDTSNGTLTERHYRTPWHAAVRMRPSLAHYPGQSPGARIICPRQDAG
ncbi:hypothetical protein DOT67_13030, partial [Ralstonia pseudosolanacearum]